ncbi:hypothetical protein VCCP103710_3349, partial [Vibrio cholerae CP1037(10)]
MVVIYLFLAL